MSTTARVSEPVTAHESTTMGELKHLSDESTLLILLGVAMVVAVPWFLRDLDINLAPVTWSIFVFAVICLIASRLAERLPNLAALRWALTAMQTANIMFAAYIWHLAGNLQNPLFLLIFMLPVATAAWVLKPWRAIMLTFTAIAAVAAVAIVNSAELRWYLAQTGLPSVLLPDGIGYSDDRAFPSIELPASYIFLLLVTFGLATAALALAALSGAALLKRVHSRLNSSQRALADAQSLAAALMRAWPHPAALVYTDNFNIFFASASFLEEMQLLPESILEKNLFALVAFANPEIILKPIVGAGGDVPFVVYRVVGQTRMAKIEVRTIDHGGVRLAAIFIHDAAGQFYRDAALDAVPDAIIVAGDDRRIHYVNLAAKALFPDLHAGMDATGPLGQLDATEDWWKMGPRTRRERAVIFAGRTFQATCFAVRIPDEEASASVLLLREGAQ